MVGGIEHNLRSSPLSKAKVVSEMILRHYGSIQNCHYNDKWYQNTLNHIGMNLRKSSRICEKLEDSHRSVLKNWKDMNNEFPCCFTNVVSLLTEDRSHCYCRDRSNSTRGSTFFIHRWLSLSNESPPRYLSNELLCTLLIHQTTQNGVHKTIGFSSSGIRVLDFLYYKKTFGALF